jgi:prepilin-type N-terminal cleavage/methylation domain-containing protein
MTHPTRAGRRRPGFTLIELLVVVAIIAVLIALLLPAVQAAREAARRSQCSNNLMQVVLALKNYESAHEVLPPGSINPTGPIANKPAGYHHNWISQILPFLEHRNVHNHTNFNVGVYAAENVTVRTVSLHVLNCPSDGRTGGWGMGRSTNVTGVAAAPVMTSSYAGVHHDTEAPIDVTNHGVLYLNSAVRFEEIGDGSSQTAFIGEHLIQPGDLGWASGTKATLRNMGEAINQPQPSFLPLPPPTTPAKPAAEPDEDDPGAPKTKKATATAAKAAEAPADPVGGFSSHHPGVASFAFGDGSVRYIKASATPRILHLLGNRNDGEMLSAEQF